MNNPFPRTNSFMSRYMTNKELASSVNTGLNPREEEKANEIVARLLDEGVIDHQPETPTLTVDMGDSEKTVVNRNFVLPSEEECGLWNPAIQLDESQVAAVEAMVQHQYACLIGAAGTGKTTVEKYLLKELIYRSGFEVKYLDAVQGLNIACVAFTGMATQVMKDNFPEWMHGCCKTIHALLEFAPEEVENKNGEKTRVFMPRRNNLRKLEHKILLIDESSMLGIDLWRQLIAACQPGTRIYMIGDLNQLPPIIGQPIFAYALSRWPVFELTKVHRQKEAGANRIVEVAHQVLNGRSPTFDVSKGNPDWRVLFTELDANPVKAQKQILSVLNQLRQHRLRPDDPTSPMIYNPHADRVMTAGNGYDENVTSSSVQQHQLNEQLSLLIQPPSEEHPRYIIDAGRAMKKFAVNLRVMATKNEKPDELDRVTNGMAGTITDIYVNQHYKGNHDLVGIESEVVERTRARLADMRNGGTSVSSADLLSEMAGLSFDSDEEESGIHISAGESEEEIEGGGAASHVVCVRFDNGATRKFSSKAGVESIQLAFCSTVAKCQGSQFETAIIICHHADKSQLSREWLYTAITRASKRVIILGTNYAVRYAIGRQKIKGATLAEKIQRYYEMMNDGFDAGYAKIKVKVPLTIEEYDGQDIQYGYSL